MKKIITLLLLLLASLYYSQCNCAKNFGSWVPDSTFGIQKTSDGFLYGFDIGTTNNDFPYMTQYLMKFDFNCNLLWKKPIKNETFTVDSFDNIYTYFMEGVPQDYTFKVRKYDPVGNLIWEKSIKNKGIDATSLLGNSERHLFVRNNKLYVAGVYRYDLNFEDKVVFHHDNYGYKARAFIATYTTDGVFIDAREFGDGITEIIQNFEADNDGNIYITYGEHNLKFYKIQKINSNLQDIILKTFNAPAGEIRVPTVLHYNKYNSKLYSYDVTGKATEAYKQAMITEYNPNTLDILRTLEFNNNSYLGIPSDPGSFNSLYLNRMYFTEENATEMYAFGQFHKSLNLNGVQLSSHEGQPGYYSVDLVFFKIDTNTLTPQFIFQSTSPDTDIRFNAPKQIMMKDGRIYLTGNFSYKKMLLNGILINNNSGNGEADAFLFSYHPDSTIGSLYSNSPVCPGGNLELHAASGGLTYKWTGPNGFTSNLQNPTIPNATAVNAGTYYCTILGTDGCDGAFSIEIKVEDKLPPVPDVQNLPNITGDCKIQITSFPTATDACDGKITATTTDPLFYALPGTYTITWKFTDASGNTTTQQQKVVVNSPALPVTQNMVQIFCAIDKPKISDFQISGIQIKWYDVNGNLLNPNTLLEDGKTYYASQTIDGCESNRIGIQAKLTITLKPTANTTQEFCSSQMATLANLTVTGHALKFYSASGALLPLSTLLVDGVSYFVTQTLEDCESEKLAIKVVVSPNSLPAHDVSASFCNVDQNPSMTINLKDYESEIIVDSNQYYFEYYDNQGTLISDPQHYAIKIGQNIFEVKVSTADGCLKYVNLSMTLLPKPNPILPEFVQLCDGQTYLLDVGLSFKSYLWNTGDTTSSILVDNPGIYTVTVTNAEGCEATARTTVTAMELGKIIQIVIHNRTVEIIMSTAGDFLYSIDGIYWQDSNVFPNVASGTYTALVKTKAGCFVDSQVFVVFDIPNVFTPNHDGINDTWVVDGIGMYPGASLKVFDRYGTMVFSAIAEKNKAVQWDGTFQRKAVPTGSYWYEIRLPDNRIMTGWVVVKNRN